MFQINLEREKLEKYKNEISVYEDYKEKINKLEEKKKSLRPSFVFYFGIYFFIIFLISIIKGGGFWGGVIISFLLSLYFSLFSFESDFLANLLSFGRFNKLKKQIKEIDELRQISYSKLRPFEEETKDYCQAQLREFFENNLYKKRSGNQQFEESLSEFASTIEELSVINSNFITTNVPLKEYEDYLIKRTINHGFQASKKSEKLSSIRNFAKDISGAQKPRQREVIAPEKLYRTARKIDNWEEINRNRKMTGLQGEGLAVVIEQEFFKSIGRKDLAEKVRHVSVEEGDGLGYDILSFFENGNNKYIEVKSTTASIKSPFYLSRNELGFLKDHNKDAFIYRVLVSGDIPQIKIYSSPEILEKLENNEIIPVQYLVRGSE